MYIVYDKLQLTYYHVCVCVRACVRACVCVCVVAIAAAAAADFRNSILGILNITFLGYD